jgi:hypothetical protein
MSATLQWPSYSLLKPTNYETIIQPPTVTSSLLGPNILLCALFSMALSLFFLLMWGTRFHTHRKQQIKLEFSLRSDIEYCFKNVKYLYQLMERLDSVRIFLKTVWKNNSEL